MVEIKGTFVTEIDGIQFYTDGIIHSGGSISVNIAYIDFSREWDNITDTGAWQVGASTGFPIVNVDSNGNTRVGGSASVFDAGVVRFADGTIGVYGGASIGGPLLGLSISASAGGGSATNNLGTYNYYSVSADGTVRLVEHTPGNSQYPHVKITISEIDSEGNAVGEPQFTWIPDAVLAADMAAGLAPHIYDERAYWGLNQCFISGTIINMWDGSHKPIEDIRPDDQVMSYDANGALTPSRVTKTLQNRAKHILDVHTLMVTPGHVTLCGDGEFSGRHVPIIDILRSDGALVREDGSKLRAATNCDLGTLGDRMVRAITGDRNADGTVHVRDSGEIRYGTRFIMADGRDVSVAELVDAAGGILTDDGLIATPDAPDGTPFFWPFADHLPKPEDYVLQRSALHLNDVYQAGEWEAVPPQMPVPTYGEAGPVVSDHPAIRDALPPNIPLAMRGQGNDPVMNRKQRRAYNAKMRKVQ